MSGRSITVRRVALMVLWECTALSLLQCWVVGAVASRAGAGAGASTGAGGSSEATGPFAWLLSDKGPFHHSQEFSDFTERYQQGFTTKYKIYR